MAQRIVTLCDAHQQHDEDTAGATWEVSLQAPGASKPTTWEVDLCEDDGKPLEDLATFLGSIGRQTDGPRRKRNGTPATAARASSSGSVSAHTAPTSEWACPVDGCGKVPKGRKALQSHLRTYHDGMSLASAMGEPEPYVCPECGQRAANPQGLGAHRRAVHGVAGVQVSESVAG
jgi:hypothetical protein